MDVNMRNVSFQGSRRLQMQDKASDMGAMLRTGSGPLLLAAQNKSTKILNLQEEDFIIKDMVIDGQQDACGSVK